MLAPRFAEGIDAIISDTNLRLGRRGCESLQNNRDEEVEEDEADHQDEGDEVEVRDSGTTALDPIELLRLVGLLLYAAIVNVRLPGAIMHNTDPAFSCSHSQ